MSDATIATAARDVAVAASSSAATSADGAADSEAAALAHKNAAQTARVGSETARDTAEDFATGFTAGTATALAPGSAPTLDITGPPGAKVLDLGIPEPLVDDASLTALDADAASAFRVQSDARLSATYARKPVRADELVAPVFIAHRGAANIYPEESIEGFRWAMQTGYVIDLDVRSLSDGTLVCIHDATLNRTTTGTGNVADTTLAQWRALQLKPHVLGGKRTRPVELEQVFNEFGGRAVISLEVKDEASLFPTLNMIVNRGLQRSVLINSSSYPHLLEAVSRGIPAMYLSDIATPATVYADGIRFIGASTSATGAYIASCVAAGLKVYVYTVNTPTQAATFFGYGATGVFSNDPAHTAERYTRSDVDPFADKLNWPGGGEIGSVETFSRLNEWGIGLEGTGGNTGGKALRWAGKRAASVRVRWRVRYAPTSSSDLTKWGGSMYLGRTPSDQPFTNAPLAGFSQDGYHVFVRRNGDLAAFRVDNGTAANIGTNTADPDIAASAAEGFVDLQLEVTATSVTFKNLTTGATVGPVADTTHRLGGVWELCSLWSAAVARISNVSVEDLS